MARNKTAVYQRVRVDVPRSRGGTHWVCLVAVVVVPAFVLGLLFVRLNSDHAQMSRRITEMRRDFGLRSKELENLRVEVEMYRKGNRILSQARAMGLDLRPPERGQVIRVRNGVPVRGGSGHPEAVVATR